MRANQCWAAALCIGALAATSDIAAAVPTTPVYAATYGDAVTGPNEFLSTDGKRHWTITPGADSYQNDFYERPTAKSYGVYTEQVSGTERYATGGTYYGYLDIEQGRVGFDAQYLYVSLDTWSLDERTDSPGQNITKSLIERYGFRLGNDANGPRSANGMLFVVDQPSQKLNPTQFNGDKATGFRDTNGDVGGVGISVTKQDLLSEVNGNGYDLPTITQGMANNGTGPAVLFSRVNPTDASIVEFALDYVAYGWTAADFLDPGFYLEIEANKGGPKDPMNYLWNDEYDQSEAGSPYRATTGDLSLSEFGTQGFINIYELDTLRMGAVPEPSAALAAGAAALGALTVRRRGARRP